MKEGFLGKVLGVQDELEGVLTSLSLKERPFAILDILLVAALFYWIYLLIRQTRALQILYGIGFLAVLWLLAQVLDLTAVKFILRFALTALVVAIPIVFQPELRAGLERLGRTRIVGDFYHLKRSEILDLAEKVSEACKVLAKRKIGALIVIARSTGLKEIVETGTVLEATLSTELLLNIFSPKTPLHDGAVIITGNKIVSARSLLPLSESKFDSNLGTRHRAAVGVSAQSDALAIVISEERGDIGLAEDGLLETGLSPENLKEKLIKLLTPKRGKKGNG